MRQYAGFFRAKKHKRQESLDEKQRRITASRLQTLLYKHKEALKKDILKKRALLDKALQQDVAVRDHYTEQFHRT